MEYIKKFLQITGNLAFTYAGSAVVLMTLSGETRRLAAIATATALIVHYTYELAKKD